MNLISEREVKDRFEPRQKYSYSDVMRKIETTRLITLTQCKDCAYMRVTGDHGLYCEREFPRRKVAEDGGCTFGAERT